MLRRFNTNFNKMSLLIICVRILLEYKAFFAAEQQHIGSKESCPKSKAPQGRNIIGLLWDHGFV
jgi:hypothetical protein